MSHRTAQPRSEGPRITAPSCQPAEKDVTLVYMLVVNPSLAVHIVLSSVQFSCSAMSDSLWPHGLHHARPPCPSPTPGVYSNSCPSSQWCHLAISSSVVPFSSCPQYLPASGSFPMSQLFTWGGQSMEFQLQHQSFQWTPRTDLL